MNWTSGKRWHWWRRRCCVPRHWRLPRKRKISSRRCSVALAARAHRRFTCRSATRVAWSSTARGVRGYGGGQAYCVRSCDGRYFPMNGPDNQSRVSSCNDLCPASDTKVVYGSSIDNAATESGKPYSELSNAFRYRNEMVAGCTCNGKDQIGLARSRSKTIRRCAKATSSPATSAGGRQPRRRQAPAPRSTFPGLGPRSGPLPAAAGGGT